MRILVLIYLGTLLVILPFFVCWYYPAGTFSIANYQRIQVGMPLAQVNHLFGSAGEKIDGTQVTRIVDWSVPLESPKRIKPVVSGDEIRRWRQTPDSPIPVGAHVNISFVDGKVKEKYGWWPAP